jgi:hypothetical protein
MYCNQGIKQYKVTHNFAFMLRLLFKMAAFRLLFKMAAVNVKPAWYYLKVYHSVFHPFRLSNPERRHKACPPWRIYHWSTVTGLINTGNPFRRIRQDIRRKDRYSVRPGEHIHRLNTWIALYCIYELQMKKIGWKLSLIEIQLLSMETDGFSDEWTSSLER